MANYIKPPAPRAHLAENGDALRVVIPARRNWFILLFLPFWLMGWAVGEVTVLFALLSGKANNAPTLFLLAWLCGWTVGGAWALFLWSWNAKGREDITASSDVFSVRYEAFGIGKTWDFDPKTLRNLRATGDGAPPWYMRYASGMGSGNYIGIWHGPLAFDYGAKTYRFGAGLDEAEARDLLPHLLRRLSPDDPAKPASALCPTDSSLDR